MGLCAIKKLGQSSVDILYLTKVDTNLPDPVVLLLCKIEIKAP